MATTSASSSIAAATTTSSIDVSSIVSSLMQSANVPLDSLNAKIKKQELIVSDLGAIKSKATLLQTALNTFEDKTSYALASTTSSNSQISASATNGATLGNYDIQVTQTAEQTKINIGGQNTLNQLSAKTVDARGFSITVGGSTYTYSAGTATTLLTDLRDYINSLGANVSANIIPIDSTNWNLSIMGKKTGVANKISVANLNGGSATDNGDGTGSAIWSSGVTQTNRASGITYSTGITSTNNLSFASAQNSSSPSVLLSQGGALTPEGTYTLSSTSNSILTITNGLTGLSQTIPVQAPNLNATNSLNFSQFGIVVNYTTSANAGDTAEKITSDLAGKSITVSKPAITGENLSFSLNAVSKNTLISVNGIGYVRDSNTIGDLIPNLTINVAGNVTSTQSPIKATIGVNQGTDNTSTILQNFSTAYNDLISLYNTLVANPTSAAQGGDLYQEKSLLAYISDLKVRVAGGFTINNVSTSFTQIGLDFLADGTTKFNAIKFASAKANGLQANLANGATVGFTTTTDTLKIALGNLLKFQGVIDLQTNGKKNTISNMYLSQARLTQSLEQARQRYTTQYSTLNTLLFNLNNTSKSLSSSLVALTNMSAGK